MIGKFAKLLLCALLGLMIWIFTHQQEQDVLNGRVPVTIAPQMDIAVLEISSTDVSFTLKGPKSRVQNIRMQELKLHLPIEQIQGKREAEMEIRVTPERFKNLPRGVKISNIFPSSIRVKVSRQIRKYCKVKPQIEGQAAKGYEIRGIMVNPEEVEVNGSERILETSPELLTRIINIEGAKATIEKTVYIVPRIEGQTVALSRHSVEIKIFIIPQYELKEFRDIPVHLLLKHNAQVKPKLIDPKDPEVADPRVFVILRGPGHLLNTLNPVAYIDLSNDKYLTDLHPKGEYQVAFILPPEVVIVGDAPKLKLNLGE